MIETWKNDFEAFVNSLNLSRDDYKTMMEYIDELSAVQPDHNADIGKKVEGACISRQAAIDALLKEFERDTPKAIRAKLTLEKLPAAQPEIIQCKDCKYSSPNGKYGCKSYHYRLYETHEMKPDDFCSFAERRTNG